LLSAKFQVSKSRGGGCINEVVEKKGKSRKGVAKPKINIGRRGDLELD
jgi:hypothetical protein